MKDEKNTASTENQPARIAALLAFLAEENNGYCNGSDIVPDDYTENQFNTPDGDFLVLTDEEATEAAAEYIKNSLWAFNAGFILEQCGIFDNLNCDEWQAAIESLQDMQRKLCESCNGFFSALINGTCGIDAFIENAIDTEYNGRGHFLAAYDGEENISEDGKFYIYRVN